VILSVLIARSSDPTSLLIWPVIGFCAGIGLFVYGFRLLQHRRLILDTPFSKIRSASMGMVEISGLAVGPYTMIAPITARPCYYYRTLAWEYKQNGKNKEWVKVAAESMHVPFFVNDNTGCVLVDPRGASLDLHCDFKEEFNNSFFSSSNDAPSNVNSFLARHGVVTGNKIKVEEHCIKPKNSLFILGTLAENPGIEIGPQPIRDETASSFKPQGFSLSRRSMSFSISINGSLVSGGAENFETGSPENQLALQRQTRMPEVIRLSPESAPLKATDMTQQQKIAAALLKAGISNPAAWTAAGVPTTPAGVQVVEDRGVSDENGDKSNHDGQATAGFDLHPPVVLMKGTNNKTFLISWRSQQEVARSLGWKCTLMIWGGPALALLSLYFLLNFRHLL
jgi:E3 Ubiquitin ligase